jgi:hypothetical protein
VSVGAALSYVAIPRRIPLLVTTTYEQVVWLDLPEGESPEEFAAAWQEEPGEMFDQVSPGRADNVSITIAYAPDDRLVQTSGGFIGPTFASGAWTRAEDDRYYDYIRRATATGRTPEHLLRCDGENPASCPACAAVPEAERRARSLAVAGLPPDWQPPGLNARDRSVGDV